MQILSRIYFGGFVEREVADGPFYYEVQIGWYCVSIANPSTISANIIKHRCGEYTLKRKRKEGEEDKDPEEEKPKCRSLICRHRYCKECKEQMEEKYGTQGQSAGSSHPQPAEEPPPPYERYVIYFPSKAWLMQTR